MNSRKAIVLMLALGLAVILLLTYVPYSLVARAGLAIRSLVSTDPPAVEVAEPPRPPAFDVAAWYAERGEDPELHGVLIETFDGGRTLAAHNPDKTFNPASLIKLATSLAVLRTHGPDYRFETRVYADGVVDASKTLKGRLVVAGADPVFGDVHASLIARELRARGIERVAGQVVATPGFCFNYSEKPDDSAARMAKVMQLKERGTGVGDAPAGSPLFTVKSQTLREILLYMNAHSSNFVAERLGTLVGGPDGLRRFLVTELKLPEEQVVIARASGREQNRMTARGILAVIRALKSEAERHGLRLEDLMPVASDDAGTLRRRLEGTPLERATLGKTGTLTAEVDGGMASLAGVIYTERAGMVVFAILDQGSRIAENRELEDLLLSQVVAAEERPVPNQKSEERRRLLPPTSLRVEPEMLAGLTSDDHNKQNDETKDEAEQGPKDGRKSKAEQKPTAKRGRDDAKRAAAARRAKAPERTRTAARAGRRR